MDKDLEYYLMQARRIAEHRSEEAEKGIRKKYKDILAELKTFLADTYGKYADDEDKLTYALLQQKSEAARYLEEVTTVVNENFPEVSEEIRQLAFDVYTTAYDGMVKAVEKSDTTEELAKNLKGLRNITPEIAKRVVENPLHGLTLSQTLEKNRKIIIHEIKKELGTGLANGDRYSTMAKRLTKRVNIDYRKAIRIIRTEGHRVQEAGFYDSADDINKALDNGTTAMRLHKTWKTMQDSKVRIGKKADHRAMNNISIPLEELFDLGHGVTAEAPGNSGNAANDCNCRCFLKYELKEDEAAKKKLEEATKPKKKYVTQKVLKQQIEDAEKQQDEILKKYSFEKVHTMSKNDYLMIVASKEDYEKYLELEQNKSSWKMELEAKIKNSEKSKILKQKKLAEKQVEEWQKKVDNFDTSEQFENIWKDPVTVKDWKSKKDKIESKLAYFDSKFQEATDFEDENKWLSLIQNTQYFDEQGKKYYELVDELDRLIEEVNKLENKLKNPKAESSYAEAYTQKRKDNALWTTSKEESDDVLRPTTSKVWKAATEQEKDAAYDYTRGSGKFNRPLSGFEGGWYNKKGVGKVDLDYEGAKKEIEELTKLIEKSTQSKDVWLQRGCGTEAMESFFNMPDGKFSSMSNEEMQSLIGKKSRMYAFTSCGSAKGSGFSSDVILNIYCPKGTQMLYAEPFSHYSGDGGRNWDGESKQSYFGSEFETIIQRGASYTVTKIEKTSSGMIYIDLEVHPENGYELIK